MGVSVRIIYMPQPTKTDRQYASELLQLAFKEMSGDTPVGAIQHIVVMAREKGLRWASDHVANLAYDAVENAVQDWLNGRPRPNLKPAAAWYAAATQEGFDLQAIALRYLDEMR